MSTHTFRARCTGCQKTWEMTPAQVKQADELGYAISECCAMPATVVSVVYRPAKKSNPQELTK